MPQMNPMWWFSLFLMFTFTLILTNSLNYFYSKINSECQNKTNINKKLIDWKW